MSNSPQFKNIGSRPKQSPIELKEKLRKNYKNKIQNCRSMLMDRLRNSVIEEELCNTLSEIYKSMFNFSNGEENKEEYEVMDELKNELVHEELEWLTKEYEKSQMDDVDWSSIAEDNNVICPVCQKTNLQLLHNVLICSCCKFAVKTMKSLPEIKQFILASIEGHNSVCNNDVQFGAVSENIYLLCDTCMDMKLVI